MMAMVQVRRPSAGQAYYRRKRDEGKSPKEALRCLKRRLSDAVYRCLLADQHDQRPQEQAGRPDHTETLQATSSQPAAPSRPTSPRRKRRCPGQAQRSRRSRS
jgi:transposase